jgi:potassium/hydrogen antiporter
MEPGSAIETAKNALAVIAVVLATGTGFTVVARALRVPDVVIFLLGGLLVGPGVLGWINVPVGSALNQLILIFGASYIVFDGGVSLRVSVLRQVWISVALLATLGVVVTALVTAVAAQQLLGIPFAIAMLLAATLASTDPATLVPVLRHVNLRDRLAHTVIAESACNDATGSVLTLAVLGVVMGTGAFSLSNATIDVVWQGGLGATVGALCGFVAALLIAHRRFGFLRDRAPLVSLIAVVGAYLGADRIQASGFMAVFVAGIVVGNMDVLGLALHDREKHMLEDYGAITALVMRMFIFILLGSQVDFALMQQYLGGGVAVVVVLMLLARPLTVFLCAAMDRQAKWSVNEMLFMCWTRETGVIPGALAGMLLGIGAPGAQMIASVTFIAILMTILLQATTTPWLARRLDLLDSGTAR